MQGLCTHFSIRNAGHNLWTAIAIVSVDYRLDTCIKILARVPLQLGGIVAPP